jgi:hypothetical protein
MPGCSVQWYGKLPAAKNVRLNWPPGAIGPDCHDPSVAVESCVLVSLFIHVIVVPAATSIGFGAYAVVVSDEAPLTIETAIGADGDGGFDGDEGEYDEDPQPAVNASNIPPATMRTIMFASCSGLKANSLPADSGENLEVFHY